MALQFNLEDSRKPKIHITKIHIYTLAISTDPIPYGFTQERMKELAEELGGEFHARTDHEMIYCHIFFEKFELMKDFRERAQEGDLMIYLDLDVWIRDVKQAAELFRAMLNLRMYPTIWLRKDNFMHGDPHGHGYWKKFNEWCWNHWSYKIKPEDTYRNMGVWVGTYAGVVTWLDYLLPPWLDHFGDQSQANVQLWQAENDKAINVLPLDERLNRYATEDFEEIQPEDLLLHFVGPGKDQLIETYGPKETNL